jgi:hypothetical protein
MTEMRPETQAERLEHFRDWLGESAFQRIQRDVWRRFCPKKPPITNQGVLAPPALHIIFDELIKALREAAKHQAHLKELARRVRLPSGPLWELLKNGVYWSATLSFRTEPLTAQEHLKVLADVAARSNALHDELKAPESRIAGQRALVAEDIAFIQQHRDRLDSHRP